MSGEDEERQSVSGSVRKCSLVQQGAWVECQGARLFSCPAFVVHQEDLAVSSGSSVGAVCPGLQT